jgi:hypothetical protein
MPFAHEGRYWPMSGYTDARPPSREPPPRVRLAKGQEVSLGCGTLILIALIVLIFGRGGAGNFEHEMGSLRSEVRELKKTVETQTAEIRALRDKLDKAKGKE